MSPQCELPVRLLSHPEFDLLKRLSVRQIKTHERRLGPPIIQLADGLEAFCSQHSHSTRQKCAERTRLQRRGQLTFGRSFAPCPAVSQMPTVMTVFPRCTVLAPNAAPTVYVEGRGCARESAPSTAWVASRRRRRGGCGCCGECGGSAQAVRSRRIVCAGTGQRGRFFRHQRPLRAPAAGESGGHSENQPRKRDKEKEQTSWLKKQTGRTQRHDLQIVVRHAGPPPPPPPLLLPLLGAASLQCMLRTKVKSVAASQPSTAPARGQPPPPPPRPTRPTRFKKAQGRTQAR